MSKDIKIEDGMQERVAAFLPDALAKALTSYHAIVEAGLKCGDAKDFENYHKACKAAISHIELLIRLAERVGLPNARAADGNQQIILSALLQEAQDEIEEYKERT